jgi:hypothetical protein
MKGGWGVGIRQAPTQDGAQPLQVSNQSTALRAALGVALDIHRAEGIELVVKVSLRTPRFGTALGESQPSPLCSDTAPAPFPMPAAE